MTSDSDRHTHVETFVPWREFLTGSQIGSLALVCLAVWLHAADSMIMATMLPIIVDDVGGGAFIGWSVSLYEIGSIVAGTASALMTMRWGLRKPMVLAALLFGCGCAISALSPNMATILIGRAVQGLGGGGLVAMSFIAVNTLFVRRYTARALATVSTVWGLSAFLGPLVGGTFVQFVTWRWGFVFFALQALCLAIWIGLRRQSEEPVQVEAVGSVPFGRLFLIFSSVVLISLGSFESQPLFMAACFLIGLVSLAMFFRLDAQAGEQRLFPKRAMDPRYAPGAALIMVLSIAIATTAMTAFGPLLLIKIHGISPMEAGYILACTSVGWTVTAVLVSGSPERLDRHFIALGISVSVLSIGGLYYAVPNGSPVASAIFAFMEGGGLGFAWTFILRLATSHAAQDDVKRVSGAFPTTLRLGYALGAAYLGTVANAAGMASMADRTDAMQVARWIFLGCGPFAILAIVATVALIRYSTQRTART